MKVVKRRKRVVQALLSGLLVFLMIPLSPFALAEEAVTEEAAAVQETGSLEDSGGATAATEEAALNPEERITALTEGVEGLQERIDVLSEEAGSLRERKETLHDQIGVLSDGIFHALEEKARLDGEIEALDREIGDLEAQIGAYEARIAQTGAELADAEAREAEQYALFRERVRSMEEKGRFDYLSVLFRAKSFSDLLSRIDFVSQIMESDQRVMDNLKELQNEIAGKQAELETEKQEVEAVRAGRMDKQAELDARREAANALIVDLEANRTEAESSLDDLSAEEEAVQEEIVRLSRQLAEEEAEAARLAALRGDLITGATLGGYAWPVHSHQINSFFGGRASPGGIGSTNHKGVDIGNVGYGTTVYASKAGTVIISQYSSSYGNYVVISHGAGNTTLYAHMSRRDVSVGDYVSQLDPIGTTGSTGRSTGPHLHFEITENDVRINPLTYLTDYYRP